MSSSLWYVVYTQPRGEARAVQHLVAQGYNVFAPFLPKKVRHARQSKVFMVSLFPRYVFVALDLSHDMWRSINGTAGVCSLVTSADRPLPLPSGFVEALIAAHASGVQWGQDEGFQVNQSARFDSGPFAELIGRIQCMDGNGRVKVILEIMGRSVSVQTSVSQLRAMST
jgi:transcription elongation factor/antiterminator RfaH